MIYFISDLHLNHNKIFVWGRRGFNSVEEMNETLIERFNARVTNDDEVWILGDVALGDINESIPLLQRLNGKIHIVIGNHDTDTRVAAYQELGWDCHCAMRLKYKKKSFFLSHYPAVTYSPEDEHHRNIWEVILNLHGHTHSTSRFWHENPYMYHVGVEANGGYPISIDEICEDIKKKIQEFRDYDVE